MTKSRKSKAAAKTNPRHDAAKTTVATRESFVDAAFDAATKAAVDVLTFGRSALVKTSALLAKGAKKLGTLARQLDESHATT